jgi:hypothetical protein
VTRYSILYATGKTLLLERRGEWHIQHFDGPIVPSPAFYTDDNEVLLFDPRAVIVNLSTGEVEYDGPSLCAVVDGKIVRRRFAIPPPESPA